MKQIEDTVAGKDIYKIIGNTNGGLYNTKSKIILHTIELDIPIKIIESVEILRDYNNNIADYTVATFLMEMGDYIKDVHVFKDNLAITIITTSLGIKTKQTYKFIISNNNTSIDGSRYTNSSREELNKLEQVRVIGQCIDLVTEALRLQKSSGIYKDTDVKETIRVSILSTLEKIKINGVTPKVYFNFYDPHNKRVYKHVKIPTGTNIMDIPSYLQEIDYGVYNGGIGTYIQRHILGSDREAIGIFIYPLYNRDVFDNTSKKLIVYGVNSMKFEMVENTYLLDGDLVKIISGASTNSINTGENNFMNTGVGVTHTKSNDVLERNNIITDEGVFLDTDLVNAGGIHKERKDKSLLVNHLGVQDNTYPQQSDILKSNMMLFQITWRYANPELIYPGMPVMYNYMDIENGLIKLKGVVQSFYIMYNEGTNTVNSIINIMVEKPYIDPTKTLSPSSNYFKRRGA